MKKEIRIGVSAFFFYPDPSRPHFGKKTIACLENDMARYLTRPGVTPILIADLEGKALQQTLSGMDGFVLQGGSDVCPETYKTPYLDKKRWPGDPFRDFYEMRILDHAVKTGKPLLGICRGFQLINVYFGGTLYQDLKTEKNGTFQHRDADLYDQRHHSIVFPPGLLQKIYGKKSSQRVNSVHHQGVKELGKHLHVEALCPEDGLVEAVSYHDLKKRFILGVQWHPEFSHTLKSRVLDSKPLYDYFLKEVRRRK